MGSKDLIICKCEYCGNFHNKVYSEYNRSMKKGRKLFCNSSCSAKFYNASKKSEEIIKSCKL